MQDKRRCSRLPCRLELRYQPRGAGDFNNALSDDISVQGMSFVNDRFIALNTCVGLEINIFSTMLTPVGRVAWVNRLPYSHRYRVGVEFIEMDQSNKNYLGDYVAMRMNKLA
ncbi:MAG: PilZ domain-containing protein [Candidatus Omnitrophica bacterium]|nr:PilZ domain-containing protein [Candidatus Omnitrophota bacterium]